MPLTGKTHLWQSNPCSAKGETQLSVQAWTMLQFSTWATGFTYGILGCGEGVVLDGVHRYTTRLYEGARLIPVAHRATKVWACLRMICLLSSATGILVRKCSIKSWGVIAARFHFSLCTRSSSICYIKKWDKRERGKGGKNLVTRFPL